MAAKIKNVKLDDEDWKQLGIQALNKGFRSLQSYIEHLLTEQSKESK